MPRISVRSQIRLWFNSETVFFMSVKKSVGVVSRSARDDIASIVFRSMSTCCIVLIRDEGTNFVFQQVVCLARSSVDSTPTTCVVVRQSSSFVMCSCVLTSSVVVCFFGVWVVSRARQPSTDHRGILQFLTHFVVSFTIVKASAYRQRRRCHFTWHSAYPSRSDHTRILTLRESDVPCTTPI